MSHPHPSRTGATLTALKASIPREKWPRKLARVAAGIAFFVAGYVLTAKMNAPWWAAATCWGIGAHVWAGEVINKTLMTLPKLVASAIADVLGAIVKGKAGSNDG